MSQTSDAFRQAQTADEFDWLYEDAARTFSFTAGRAEPDRRDYRKVDELLADCGNFDQRRRTHEGGEA